MPKYHIIVLPKLSNFSCYQNKPKTIPIHTLKTTANKSELGFPLKTMLDYFKSQLRNSETGISPAIE